MPSPVSPSRSRRGCALLAPGRCAPPPSCGGRSRCRSSRRHRTLRCGCSWDRRTSPVRVLPGPGARAAPGRRGCPGVPGGVRAVRLPERVRRGRRHLPASPFRARAPPARARRVHPRPARGRPPGARPEVRQHLGRGRQGARRRRSVGRAGGPRLRRAPSEPSPRARAGVAVRAHRAGVHPGPRGARPRQRRAVRRARRPGVRLDPRPAARRAPCHVAAGGRRPRQRGRRRRRCCSGRGPWCCTRPPTPPSRAARSSTRCSAGLDAAGVVEYRRITGIPAAELAELVRTADVVVDQLRLGAYGWRRARRWRPVGWSSATSAPRCASTC